MQLPVINFEASINSLNNPSLFSRILSIFELGKLSYAQRICKWGALFLALVYAFNCVVHKFKILILHYHRKSKSFLANAEPLLSSTFLDDELYTSDEEDDVVSSSSGYSSDDEDHISDCYISPRNERQKSRSSYDDFTRFEDDFTVKGSFCNFFESQGQKRNLRLLRRRRSVVDNFSLSDLVSGIPVVKLWDGVEKKFPFFAEMPVSPAVVMSAEAGEAGLLGLSLWDLRCPWTKPAVQGEWRSDRKGEIVGVEPGRTGRVYVRDDGNNLAVGDVRKVDTRVTQYEEGELWWDADGVTE